MESCPTEGYVYRLLDPRDESGLLTFSFAPLEVYGAWCARHSDWCSDPSCVPSPNGYNGDTPISACDLCARPVCDCSSTPCVAELSPRRYMDLERTGDSMQGELRNESAPFINAPVEARLRRAP